MFECKFLKCKSQFEDPSDFIDHMKQRHNLSAFNCVICNGSFTSPSVYKRHLLNEINKRQTENRDVLENLPFPNEPSCIEDSLDYLEVPYKTKDTSNLPKYHDKDDDFEEFSVNVFEMVLDLYGDMGITKKLAGDVTTHLQNVVCKPLLSNLLSKMKCQEDKNCLINQMKNINVFFEELNTEHKFKELLKRNNLYFEPHKFSIAGQTEDSKGYLFPLKKNIEALFTANPDLLLDMLLEYDELSSDDYFGTISSLVNAEVWKNKTKFFSGKKVLPILLYQDDIEINNPLGSKAGKQKISAVYITFPLLDCLRISKLSYQIPANLTLTSDSAQGLYPNYYKLCLVLKDLEENGIQLTTFGHTITVHLIVATTVGDNLGQNMILGYTMNFGRDYFCRFCITTKAASETAVTENPQILRSNVDDNRKKLGFEREVKTFQIIDCVSVDIVHDFLEGFVKIEMSGIIKHFIRMEYFDLKFLNEAMKNFDQFSRFEKKNKCSKIKKGHLDANSLKMSSSEVCLFLNYFAMYVGEHIPSEDVYWNFFKILYKLLNKAMESKFDENNMNKLQQLIKEHNEKCIILGLGNTPNPNHLIPKQHFLTHYITSIKKLGPPKYLWVMRLEGFHKCLKHYANSTSSRKNILKSLADKLQLRNSQIFFKNTQGYKIKKSKVYRYICLQQYELGITTVNISLASQVSTYFYISVENIRFELNDIVFSQNNNLENSCLYNVHKVLHIIFENGEVIFLVLNLQIKDYIEDIQMLEVAFPEQPSHLLLNLNEIVRLPTNIKKYKQKFVINISNF